MFEKMSQDEFGELNNLLLVLPVALMQGVCSRHLMADYLRAAICMGWVKLGDASEAAHQAMREEKEDAADVWSRFTPQN